MGMMNTYFIATVGKVNSCFDWSLLCFCLSTHIHPLTVLSCFSFKNISVCNWNNRNDQDDGEDAEGAAISIPAASRTTAPVTTPQQAIISSDAKSLLRAYFEKEE
jgi:hypothetical protein